MDRQVLYANGHYFVIAVTPHGEHDDSPLEGFAVVTASGAALRYETTFDSAHDWVERRLLDDARPLEPSALKTPPRRRH